MNNTLYDRGRATRLVPLLGSITREIQERTVRLDRIERKIHNITSARGESADVSNLVAEAATHRRELRLAKDELLELGCSIVGTRPLTIRIPGRRGEAKRRFVWRSGDPVLR